MVKPVIFNFEVWIDSKLVLSLSLSLVFNNFEAISCFFFRHSFFQDSEADNNTSVASLMDDSLHSSDSAANNDDDDDDHEMSATAAVDGEEDKGSNSRDIASLTIDVSKWNETIASRITSCFW